MIFDTDVLIWAFRGDQRAARVIDASADRALSCVSLMELLQSCRTKLEARQIQNSLRQLRFSVLPLSEAIGATAVSLIEQYSLSRGLQVADALIAATVLDSVDPLCTGNAKHFRPISGLTCVASRP